MISIVTLFFLLARFLINKQPDNWLRHFSAAILGILVASGFINLIANVGLTKPTALGIPFLSRDWLLAAIGAFLVGVALRKQDADATPIIPLRRMAVQTLAVSSLGLIGIAVAYVIASGEVNLG